MKQGARQILPQLHAPAVRVALARSRESHAGGLRQTRCARRPRRSGRGARCRCRPDATGRRRTMSEWPDLTAAYSRRFDAAIRLLVGVRSLRRVDVARISAARAARRAGDQRRRAPRRGADRLHAQRQPTVSVASALQQLVGVAVRSRGCATIAGRVAAPDASRAGAPFAVGTHAARHGVAAAPSPQAADGRRPSRDSNSSRIAGAEDDAGSARTAMITADSRRALRG